MRIEIDGLCYAAGKKRILNGVDAVFEGRRVYGIVGPNGCGKTTLLRHLYRQYPAKGCIRVDGVPIEDESRKAYARRVAVMMQSQAWAENELRVGEVVRTGRYPYKRVMQPYSREDEAVVEDVLRRTALWALRNRRLQTLSGGELQRVMIAKCLAQQPQVILLDEPTNHLDIRYRVELMETLRRFEGMVIVTIHDLNLAVRYCDHLYVMQDGRMIADGTPEAVLRADALRAAFEMDIPVVNHEGTVFVGV